MSHGNNRVFRQPLRDTGTFGKQSCGTKLYAFLVVAAVFVCYPLYKESISNRISIRTIPKSTAYRCPPSFYNASEFGLSSNSLNREEEILHDEYFKGICGGTYIELGAFDGIGQDNTLAFHNKLEWSGVLIEASPARFARLRIHRPGDVLVHAAICNAPVKVHFIDKEFVGGIYEFMNPEFIAFWHPDVNVEYLPTVQCSPLESIVESETAQTFFDFLSLDVEGGEYHVLETMGKLQFGIIMVESDGGNPIKDTAVRTLVESRGYVFHRKFNNSQWFINDRWHHIYRNILHES